MCCLLNFVQLHSAPSAQFSVFKIKISVMSLKILSRCEKKEHILCFFILPINDSKVAQATIAHIGKMNFFQFQAQSEIFIQPIAAPPSPQAVILQTRSQ
jgi:hypothetical protein